ncbi:MAG: putative metallopeptidase [Desulfitobacterium hafniense]|nr:putative metallopeptidase [Desulfitobacterium hafniense]
MRLICQKCGRKCDPDFPCEALQSLSKVYRDLKTESKTEIIIDLRKQLSLVDYEVADDLRVLGEKLISAMPELSVIRDYEAKIGYVRSYETKKDKGRQVNADCRKINGTYTAYLPFDFIVTFYEPNIYHMSDNQKKILMLHELRHIGIGERGFRIENHDVEDFRDILDRFGIEWNGFDQEVPDILAEVKAGGDGGRKKGTKVHNLEAKRKTNSNG